VYSVREARELAYQQLIAELPQRDYLEGLGAKLLYLPVVTRERVPGALHGRITTLIENGELERAADLQLTPEHSRIMLCGNPQMIEDTRAVLKARDLNLAMTRRPGQVAVENYW
ncbi:MAG TPA: ferredoxin--NADP(+) reductase, partial [Pseudomonas sp.]|nr:ferredoxin--NADP(+) reductase [Pseudomonas sp.]